MATVTAVNGRGTVQTRGTLLDAAAATTNGVWWNIGGLRPLVIVVSGTFVGTVQLYVSNSPTKPSDSDNTQAQLDGDITSPTSITSDNGYQWVKARVSAYTSGSIDVAVNAG